MIDERLIFCKTKAVLQEDCVPFFKTKDCSTHSTVNASLAQIVTENSIYKHSDIEYADIKLEENTELLKICDEYINKKIVTTYKIKNFVKQNFIPFEAYSLSKQMKLAWIAIAISLFTAIISIIVSAFSIKVSYDISGLTAMEATIYEDVKIKILKNQEQKLQDVIDRLDNLDNNISLVVRDEEIKEYWGGEFDNISSQIDALVEVLKKESQVEEEKP